jgi:transposase
MTRLTVAIKDIGGNAEVAEMCGVSTQAVSNWVARWDGRKDRPQPVKRIATGPLWDLREVAKWWNARLMEQGEVLTVTEP